MARFYEFGFYTINHNGDWHLYLTKTTGVLGRRSLLKELKLDGYVYNRNRRAYFLNIGLPSRFAFVITPLNPLK